MPSDTKFNPSHTSSYSKDYLNKDAKGVSTTAVAGETTDLDYLLTDDCLISGSFFLARGAAEGDKAHFQVVYVGIDEDLVINQFITDWYMNPDETNQQTPRSEYPAKLPAGLTLRVVYESVGATNVWIAINFDKDKILV